MSKPRPKVRGGSKRCAGWVLELNVQAPREGAWKRCKQPALYEVSVQAIGSATQTYACFCRLCLQQARDLLESLPP